MAKFKDFKYSIAGFEKKCNINVDKNGRFSVAIDSSDSQILNIEEEARQTYSRLSELEDILNKAKKDYYDSSIENSLHINIRYGANGAYAISKEYNVSDFSSSIDKLCFDFDIIILSKRAGTYNYFSNARELSDISDEHRQVVMSDDHKESFIVCDAYFCRFSDRIVSPDYFIKKLIPYTPEALNTLTKAKNGIKKISCILHSVMSLDDTQLISILNKGMLLEQTGGDT